MDIDKGLIGGSTNLMLLSILEQRDYYGYEIIKEIEQRSNSVFQFKEGTLYPVLHKMEGQGLISSYRMKGENGKDRKYYKITSSGLKQLEKEKVKWAKFITSVDRVVGGDCHAFGWLVKVYWRYIEFCEI